MQVRIVCPTLLLVGALVGCGTSGPRLSAYEQQLLMGASTSADLVVRGDDKTVDVMNNTVPAKLNTKFYAKTLDLEELEATSAVLRTQIKEYQRSYLWTARKYCEDRGLQVDSNSTVIGQNTIRYQCYNYHEFGVLHLKMSHAMCEGKLYHSGKPTGMGKRSDVDVAFKTIACDRSGFFSPGACAVVDKAFKGVQKPTCGFVRSLMAEHLANASQPIAPAANSNDLGFAKEKCKELGFAENTEKYGSCVLRLSR